MNLYLKITDVRGREILDSRGNPTVEAEVVVEDRKKALQDVRRFLLEPVQAGSKRWN